MMKLDAVLIISLPAFDLGSAAAWGSKRINSGPQSCLCLTWSGYPLNKDNNDNGVHAGPAWTPLSFVATTPLAGLCNQWWILDEANEAVASGPPSKIAHTVFNPLQMFVQRMILSEDLFFFFFREHPDFGRKIGKSKRKSK